MSNADFLVGFATALAELNRLHDQPTAIADTISGYGLTIADFRRAGVERYDLRELQKCAIDGGGSRERQREIMGASHGKS